MKERQSIDGAVKDLFQNDRPGLLTRLSGGVGVQSFLNVEIPRIMERRVDLVLLLEDGSVMHVEIQSTNDPDIGLRMLEYYCLLKRAHRRPVRQLLLYLGEASLNMASRMNEDGNLFRSDVVGVRSFRVADLLVTGNPGDAALALLAGDGDSHLREILQAGAKLKGGARQRLLGQLMILAGLRGLAGKLKSEVERMGMLIDIEKNEFLMEIERKGIAKGMAKGMAAVLEKQLEAKFGPLPKWAKGRLVKADEALLDQWSTKVLNASTLEGVIGKR